MRTAAHRTYPSLDSIRALAAIAVLATHTSFWTGQYGKGITGALTSRFDVGVAIFFVLSGFLLGRPYLAALAERRPAPGTRRYLWKRALRILPIYIVTVAAAYLLLEQNRDAGPMQWLRTLTLTQIYPGGSLDAGLTHMWSLAVEVGFYLLLPLLAWMLARLSRGVWNPRRLLVALAGFAAISWLWLALVAPHVAGASLWPPAFFSWFAVGLAIAVVSVDADIVHEGRPVPTWQPLRDLARLPGVCWSLAIALLLISATPLGGPVLLFDPSTGQAIAKNVLYTVIAGLVILPSVLGPTRSPYERALSWAPLRHVGHISYGIFCVHLLLIHAISDWRDLPLYQGHGWELFVLTLGLTLVVAEIGYRVVERPAMKLKNRGSRRPAATASASDTTTSA